MVTYREWGDGVRKVWVDYKNVYIFQLKIYTYV